MCLNKPVAEGLFLNPFLFDKPEKMNPETLIVINQKSQVRGRKKNDTPAYQYKRF
jgi:hypothetical protein